MRFLKSPFQGLVVLLAAVTLSQGVLAADDDIFLVLGEEDDAGEKLLAERDFNDLTPEVGPGVQALVRNPSSGFRPAGAGNDDDDDAQASPGLEKYLTLTLPPAPSTTKVIPMTDGGYVFATATATAGIKKRDPEGLFFQIDPDAIVVPDAPPHPADAPEPLLRPFDEEDDDAPTPQATIGLEQYIEEGSPVASPVAEGVHRREPYPKDEVPILPPGVEPIMRNNDLDDPLKRTSSTRRTTAAPKPTGRPVRRDEEIDEASNSGDEIPEAVADIVSPFAVNDTVFEPVLRRDEDASPTESLGPTGTPDPSPDVVNIGSPAEPIVREHGFSSAVINDRRSLRNGDCSDGWTPVASNPKLAFEESRGGAVFEVVVFCATLVMTFSSYVLAVRKAQQADAKKSGNPKLARWSTSNGIAIVHGVARMVQLTLIALSAFGSDPAVDFLLSNIAIPSETYAGMSLLLLVGYGICHFVITSSRAPLMARTFTGKSILQLASVAVSFLSSTAIIPVLTVLFQTVNCHYREGSVPIRDTSNGLCVVPCWTPEHWFESLLSLLGILLAIPLLLNTCSTWQKIDAKVDIKNSNTFNCMLTAYSIVVSLVSSVWIRSNSLVLAVFITLSSFGFAVYTFAYKPVNVRAASELTAYSFLVPAATGFIAILANFFYAERALWYMLIFIGWASVVIAAFAFSQDDLRDRIHQVAANFRNNKLTSTPNDASPASKSSESEKLNRKPISGKPNANEIIENYFEEKAVEWTQSGTLDESSAMCIADAIERSDGLLKIIFERIVSADKEDTGDSRALQALKFSIASGLLSTGKRSSEKQVATSEKGLSPISDAMVENDQASERKPLLLGREESHTQVIGAEDMI
ncbi:hypothetical protein HDU96_007356 [Phlyctochytrium bullatum]|nr:hypothetical protein HDU96_007356 [Phlyctochytrium bullatum]